MEEEKEGIELKCQKCKKEWTYKGNNEYYATCPDCHSSVKIPQGEKE